MQTLDGRVLESLRASAGVIDTHEEQLPGVAASGQRKKLDQLITEIDAHVTAQAGSDLAAKGATKKHQSLREVLLRDHMAPVARIAQAELPNDPELEALKMPLGKPSIERLRAAALGMAKAAEPFADVFVKSGLPSDFIAQLVASANATVATIGNRKQSKVNRIGATKGIRTTLSQARKTVRALDALVTSAAKDDPALLAAWKSAQRVELLPVIPEKKQVLAQILASVPAVVAPPAIPATIPSHSAPVGGTGTAAAA